MAKITQFSAGGNDYRFGDLTIGELEGIERTLGCAWGAIEPVGNARHARAVMTAFLSRTDPENAAAVVAEMTLDQFLESVKVIDDEDEPEPDPKANGTAAIPQESLIS